MATLEEYRTKLGGMSDKQVAAFGQGFWGAYGEGGADGQAMLEKGAAAAREYLASRGVLREYEGYFCLNLGLQTEADKLKMASIDGAKAHQAAAEAARDLVVQVKQANDLAREASQGSRRAAVLAWVGIGIALIAAAGTVGQAVASLLLLRGGHP